MAKLMAMKNKLFLKEFKQKEKLLAELLPKRTTLPSDWEMQSFGIGRAGMAYDILKMLEKDGVIDIRYIQTIISEWDPELWVD